MRFFILFLCGLVLGQDQFMSRIRQVTFEGKRAGESYFNPSSTKMVFQSEREDDNPFYQIYMLDLVNGQTSRISPGFGKTTCAWIHPTEEKVLYASTHKDPNSQKLMQEELDFRASGKQRRYSWDYDPQFELFTSDFQGGREVQLTKNMGYDAEGSFSPDGSFIIYASNHHAYQDKLSEAEIEKLNFDPSYFIDLYSLVPGQKPVRLTDMPGYDGGPFFSADGKKVCWRHFSEDGATAEIWTMNSDGTDQRALTSLGAMSWAPFFHPSGEYLIFTTNLQGFANFELYIVDAAGTKEPVRVTFTEKFDGLPVFFGNGSKLAWTTSRTQNGQAQIFFANWDHKAALAAIQGASVRKQEAVEKAPQGQPSLEEHIAYLASPELQGRMTGTEGESKAAAYITDQWQKAGLKPLPGQTDYLQAFTFPAGVEILPGNQARVGDQELKLDQDWRPVSMSKSGVFEGDIVFAGYGLQLEKSGEQEAYDSYVHLDAKDKWVMVLRYLPDNVDAERSEFLRRSSTIREKAFLAREKGAKGLIVVSGPNSGVREELMPLKGSASGSAGIGLISISDEVAANWMESVGKNLKGLQDTLDSGDLIQGFSLDRNLRAEIKMKTIKKQAKNVVARLGIESDLPPIMFGAHYDHLGDGLDASSLARADEKGQFHVGADDNASGTTALLELARLFNEKRSELKRDVWFGAWSGEELGLLGSTHFVNSLNDNKDLSGKLAAYFNMDMIGRLRENLIVQGLGSSPEWSKLIEQTNVLVGLPLKTSEDCFLPTDATAFYVKKVPILSIFTGAHEDYHTPRDTPDKINYEGLAEIIQFVGSIGLKVATRADELEYKEHAPPKNKSSRGGFRVYLGTIPDYAQGDNNGVKLSGVSKGGPAEKAGIQGGDFLVGLDGSKIENIYDYTHILERLKVGQTVKVEVLRGGEKMELEITPGSRD